VLDERFKGIGCQVCNVFSRNYFCEGEATNIPEKIKSVEFDSRGRLFHEHKMSETTNKFSLPKKNGPIKPEMFYKIFYCYHLKQARTQPGPEHYLCYQAKARRRGRVGPRPEDQTRAREDL
jgi:hypothetical protein